MNFHFIFSEVDGLLDAEECDLLVAIAQGKGMKLLRQQISPLKIGQAEKLLRDWDYDQDGFISQNEVSEIKQHSGGIFRRIKFMSRLLI